VGRPKGLPNAPVGFYITATGNEAEYSALMQASVMSLNALLETLTEPNFCFMSRDIPDEKHASSFRRYYLKVAPHQRPFFCICVSEYPASARALAPPLRSEWVLIHSTGTPLRIGYSNTIAASLRARANVIRSDIEAFAIMVIG
jgi:hypothetical protein